MGMRSGTTFKKRQKELARMEKQRDKAARRLQRKAEKLTGEPSETDSLDIDAEAQDAGDTPDAPKEEGMAGSPGSVLTPASE